MSTGTNKERLEQNNIKLEEIKTQIQNLPEKVDYEEVYSKLDNGFNILEPINMSSKFSSLGFSMYNSVDQYRILNDKYIIVSFKGNSFNQYTGLYTYLIDLEQDISTEIFRCNNDNFDCMFLGETDENVYIAGQDGPTSIQYAFYLYTYNKSTQSISSSILRLYTDTGSTGHVYSNYTKALDDYYLYWTDTSNYYSNWDLYRAKFDLQQLKFTDIVKINYTTGTGGMFRMTSPSIFCYSSTTTSTLDYNILKLVNNDTGTIKGNIENLSGTDYFGAKAFANGNVYELNEDLTLGNLLAENAYDYSQGYISTLDDVHYKLGNYVYTFDEDTNTFTKIIENSVRKADVQVYMYGKDGSDYKLTPISFLETTNSSSVIGTNINGNFYSKPTTVSLDNSKLLNGTSIVAVNGVSYKGTMPNNGALNYTSSTEEQTIPAGYTSGGTIAGVSNLNANNIVYGVQILDVTGDADITNTLNGRIYSSSIIGTDTASTATINIAAEIGSYVYAFIYHRAEITSVTEGWTLFNHIQPDNTIDTQLSIYCKIAETNNETFTVNQASSVRLGVIGLSGVGLHDTMMLKEQCLNAVKTFDFVQKGDIIVCFSNYNKTGTDAPNNVYDIDIKADRYDAVESGGYIRFTVFVSTETKNNVTVYNSNSEDSFIGSGILLYRNTALTGENLLPENIKKGVTIFGVTGTFEATTEVQEQVETLTQENETLTQENETLTTTVDESNAIAEDILGTNT